MHPPKVDCNQLRQQCKIPAEGPFTETKCGHTTDNRGDKNMCFLIFAFVFADYFSVLSPVVESS